jgi:WD40 repeat protein
MKYRHVPLLNYFILYSHLQFSFWDDQSRTIFISNFKLGPAIIVGSVDGVIAVVDMSTGLTIRLIHDHKGAPITSLNSVYDETKKLTYWLAASHDRRTSVWSYKWNESMCQMVDWLTFQAPYSGDKNQQHQTVAIDLANAWKKYSKSHAQFAPISSKHPAIDTIILSYGYKREILIYNFIRKQIVRSMSLTEWPESLSIAPHSNLIAYGTSSRLLQIKDYNQATFQDYAEHSDTVSSVCFSSDGKRLFSAAFNEIFIWDVLV